MIERRKAFWLAAASAAVFGAAGWLIAQPSLIVEVLPKEHPTEIVSLARASGENAKTADTEGEAENSVRVPKKQRATVVISAVMAGSEKSASDEYVELLNMEDAQVDLTGWVLRRIDAAGKESSLVSAARFEGILIEAEDAIRVANNDGDTSADVLWPSSYGLPYKNAGVILYRSDGSVADAVRWDELGKGMISAR